MSFIREYRTREEDDRHPVECRSSKGASGSGRCKLDCDESLAATMLDE